MLSTYQVEVDHVGDKPRDTFELAAESLAALCNQLRGKYQRVKVWSAGGLQLIDTKHGDLYNLITGQAAMVAAPVEPAGRFHFTKQSDAVYTVEYQYRQRLPVLCGYIKRPHGSWQYHPATDAVGVEEMRAVLDYIGQLPE